MYQLRAPLGGSVTDVVATGAHEERLKNLSEIFHVQLNVWLLRGFFYDTRFSYAFNIMFFVKILKCVVFSNACMLN